MSRFMLRGEAGFTLIELMVAMLLGIIVSTATLAIVITSVHLTSNFDDEVEATQQGRVAMLQITQALDTSCVIAAVAPILPASDNSDVWFYSSLTDAATLKPNKVWIQFTGTQLVMETYPWVSGAFPSWVFSATPTTFVLLGNAALVSSTPVFQYFGYGSAGALSTTAYPITTNLGTNAATTAEVQINFQAIPSDGWTALSRPASFSDAVVLRLSPASNATGVINLPCT
jgi:prepilin-type N-terminal cleavage/methylation domain-containing protein